MPLIGSTDITLGLETRMSRSIANFYCKRPPDDGDRLRVRDFKREYARAKHRPVGPSAAYNCHGLTFGARRTGINDPADVERILVEDGYRKLSILETILAGDIAIYQKNQEIIHSGLVSWTENDGPWVLSKWGAYHEVIHKPLDCPYSDATVSYYRLEK